MRDLRMTDQEAAQVNQFMMGRASKYIDDDMHPALFDLQLGFHITDNCLNHCVFCRIDKDAGIYLASLRAKERTQ